MNNAEAVNWLINITADIGKVEHQDLWHYEQALSEIREMLEDAPQRMRGRWIPQGWNDTYCKCSCCDAVYVTAEIPYNFCPNCGADMRGQDDES